MLFWLQNWKVLINSTHPQDILIDLWYCSWWKLFISLKSITTLCLVCFRRPGSLITSRYYSPCSAASWWQCLTTWAGRAATLLPSCEFPSSHNRPHSHIGSSQARGPLLPEINIKIIIFVRVCGFNSHIWRRNRSSKVFSINLLTHLFVTFVLAHSSGLCKTRI